MAFDLNQAQGWIKKILCSLNLTSILTVILLAIGVTTAAYISGIITGRQHDNGPEAAPREEKITPVSEMPVDKILQAHELEFTQALRDEKKKEASAPRKEASPPQPAVNPPGQEAEISPQIPEESVQSQEPENPPSANELFDFVFQVAALKDEQAADNLRQALEGEGLRTRLAANGKLYLVLVLMRGKMERQQELAQIAHGLRLGEPLLKSKKPVATPARQKLDTVAKPKDR